MIYHGVRHTAAGAMYRIGLALFALDKPQVCLARGDSWVFGPETQDELQGDVGNVTFSCGWLMDEKAQELHMYYGAADTVICLASAPLDDETGQRQ